MRPNIRFQKLQGRSGRTVPGRDYISGFVLYCADANLPSGFTTSSRIRQFLTITDVENTGGILANYNDATAATAQILITTLGATGDQYSVTVKDLVPNTPVSQTNVLCTYTQKSTDTTIALLGASITAAINANTNTTGYSATFLTATITITGPKSMGIFLNTGTPLSVTKNSGSLFATTITQFTGGIYSNQAVWHYHLSEFFRIFNGTNGTDGTFVGFFTTPVGTPTFNEITTIQQFAQGNIRQVGVYVDFAAYSTGHIDTIENICLARDAKIMNLSAVYQGNLFATADISTIADLSLLNDYKVSDVISQDAVALGAFLFLTTGKTIGHLGITMGSIALSAVSEDFGQPIDKFNMSAGGGLENDSIAFANGVSYASYIQAGGTNDLDTLLDVLDARRHIFLQKYIGLSGSYFNDNHTASSLASDYAYINDNRTIDKAIRGIYASELPLLKSRLFLNSDGTMTPSTIGAFQNAALAPLYQMNRDGDLSTVSPSDVYINPAQNVKQTSQITIQVSLNEDGIARTIFIPVGFKSN